MVRGVNVAATVGGVNLGATSIDGQLVGTATPAPGDRPIKEHDEFYLTIQVPVTRAQYARILAAGVPGGDKALLR